MKIALLLGAVLGGITSSFGQVILLDFGPTTVTGASQVNSPYHAVDPSFLGDTWNKVGTADITGGLLLANNTEAVGVTVNLGSSTSTTIDLAANPNNATSVTGTQVTTTGVYGETSVGRDATFQNATNARVGLQIGGLTAGLYDVYVIARNTNLSGVVTNNYTQSVSVGTGAAAGDFDFSGYNTATLTYPAGQANTINTATWVEGGNYLRFSVTLAEGEVLNLAVAGAGSETRGFLNAVQVVAVPEPGPLALLAAGGLLFLLARRRQPAPRG